LTREATPRLLASDIKSYTKTCKVWCVTVPTPEHLILVRRVHQLSQDGVPRSVSQALVIGNTEPTKNPGNAILYETVLTIMNIEAEGGLRVLAINILGRFLANRDNNIRYVALNTLCKIVNRDTQAIQRHRNTIVDCLKDPDISIRRRSLDLIYALVTKNNVKALVKELLNYLALTSGDNEFKADLTEKICLVVDKFAPNKHWHMDTIITVLATAGNFARENVFTDLILLIARSSPALQAYATFKLYDALHKKTKHAQLPLMHLALWCIGEYGEFLVTDDGLAKARSVDTEANFTMLTQESVLDLIAKAVKSPVTTLLTREYILNALLKLSSRFGSELE
jgi:AP-1 complex subunit gamma-1